MENYGPTILYKYLEVFRHGVQDILRILKYHILFYSFFFPIGNRSRISYRIHLAISRKPDPYRMEEMYSKISGRIILR